MLKGKLIAQVEFTTTLTTMRKSEVFPATIHFVGMLIRNGSFRAGPNALSEDKACRMYDSIRSRPCWAEEAR
jgi:hypothetical protein